VVDGVSFRTSKSTLIEKDFSVAESTDDFGAFARVATDGQSVDAEVKQLRAAAAAKVWRERASGAKNDRAQLGRVLAQLAAGDVLMVTQLNRLARSTRDLLNILAAIADKAEKLN
jgi:DNA invertase Pin-like site-specific DNA recombinase